MIDLEHRGDIAVLTKRHGKANAIDGAFCEEIIKRLGELRTSPFRAVVITGQGKIFSAGVDLVRALNGGPAISGTSCRCCAVRSRSCSSLRSRSSPPSTAMRSPAAACSPARSTSV
ncbi:MAG: hypothetical protein JO084_02250 [Bradyrhizobiaceae bacterium]|nr:hypothetical protein [Hyphomicrobiales bacterium]MBV9426531.1 hypothetical protein [Bradyrhizobiaceae bacterium]